MAEEAKKPPAELEDVVGESDPLTLPESTERTLESDSPSEENLPDFPIEDTFPNEINNMVFYQETLKKYIKMLRDLLKNQKDSVIKHAETQGIPWDKYVQMRKEEVLTEANLNDTSVAFMENWKDENFLPECRRTVMHIQWIHLCRWTLHKKIQLYYKEHKNIPIQPVHSKHETPEDLDAFDGDSSSHKEYARYKQEEEEFLQKTAVLVFNRLGATLLTERQIRSLEKVMADKLQKPQCELFKHWTEEVIKMTREFSDQTLSDASSISLDDPKSNSGANSDPTIPPTPNPSFASSDVENLKNLNLSRGDSLLEIPALPKDNHLSPDDSSIDKSDETGDCPTGECTEDELTSPEDQAHRNKLLTHKLKPKSDVDDTD